MNQNDEEQGSSGKLQKWLGELQKTIDWAVSTPPHQIESYVNMLRKQNPRITDIELAKKVVRRKSFKNGLVGAITGFPGLPLAPVTIPADLFASWRLQAQMAVAIAYIFGHTAETTDLKTDVYIIMGGSSTVEALKRAGIQTAKAVTKKAVQKYITRDVMVKIWKVIGRKIITKAGQKSLTSFTKLVPVVGAPIGFASDWLSAKAVGHFAIKYYSGGG